MLKLISLCLVLGSTFPVSAQSTFDFALSYYARENVGGSDNDLLFATGGLTWADADGGYRLAVTLGARQEFLNGDFTFDAELSALRFWNWDQGQWGGGLTLRNGIGHGTAIDLAGFGTYRASNWGLRGLVGLQGVAGDEEIASGRAVGYLALAEASFYPFENLALRGMVTLDDIDVLATTAFEYKMSRFPVSIGMEWTASIGNYRSEQHYNDLTFQLKYERKFRTIRQRDNALPIRAIYRPVSPL